MGLIKDLRIWYDYLYDILIISLWLYIGKWMIINIGRYGDNGVEWVSVVWCELAWTGVNGVEALDQYSGGEI